MKNICVFCGSRYGKKEAYRDIARQTAQAIHDKGYGLVFGGSDMGLMHEVAQTVLDSDGQVIGVIPEQFTDTDICHPNLTQAIVTKDLSERKRQMLELSEALICLPGGIGTLDEMFYSLALQQLKMSCKPLGLLNLDGYYDGLLSFLDHVVNEGFMNTEHREMVFSSENPFELVELLTS
jgi:uncharacterized protein (TIGR00730 family)